MFSLYFWTAFGPTEAMKGACLAPKLPFHPFINNPNINMIKPLVAANK